MWSTWAGDLGRRDHRDLGELTLPIPIWLGIDGDKVVTVTPPSGLQADLVWAVEWDSALGTSDNAIMDQGRTRPFDATAGNAASDDTVEVFDTSSESRDYPTDNFCVFESSQSPDGPGTSWAFLRTTGNYADALADGDSVAWRYYKRVVMTDAMINADQDIHGDEYTTQSGAQVSGPFGHTEFFDTGAGIGDYDIGIFDLGSSTWYRLPGFPLDRDVTYRREILMTRTGSTTFTLDYRIYDISDNLLFDGTNFVDGSSNQLSAQSFTGNATEHWNTIQNWHIGINSIFGYTGADLPAFEFAAFAIAAGADATWLGEYRAAEAGFTT